MCTVQEPGKNVTYFEGASPILPVADLKESIKYYVRVLGFKLNWETPVFAQVSRGKCHIMLAESDQGHPGTWVWIGVGDAELLFEEYCAKRDRIRFFFFKQKTAYEIRRRDWSSDVCSSDLMMDAAVPPAIENQVRAIAANIPGVLALDKCRVRKSGLSHLVDIHVRVDGERSVRSGHAIAHAVKDALLASPLRVTDVSVHVEPMR